MIKGITRQLIPYGRIKIGQLGDKRKTKSGEYYFQPQKLDHFLITGMEKGSDGNFVQNTKLMDYLKKSPDAQVDKSGNLTGIPISFLYNDPELNLFSRYAMYARKKCVCSGDGETAISNGKSVICPCKNIEPDSKGARKCKPSGKLTCVISGVPQVGGCYVFRTTSYNTISCLYGAMDVISSLTNGMLAGLPLQLILRPATVQIETGSATVQIVSVIFPGTQDQLRQISIESFRNNQDFIEQIKRIEAGAKQIIHASEPPDEEAAFQEEFHPDIPDADGEEPPQEPAGKFSKDDVITGNDAPADQPTGPLICGRKVCDKFDVTRQTFCKKDMSACDHPDEITVREALAIAYKTRKPEIDKTISDLGIIESCEKAGIADPKNPDNWGEDEILEIWETLHSGSNVGGEDKF